MTGAELVLPYGPHLPVSLEFAVEVAEELPDCCDREPPAGPEEVTEGWVRPHP